MLIKRASLYSDLSNSFVIFRRALHELSLSEAELNIKVAGEAIKPKDSPFEYKIIHKGISVQIHI